MIDFTCGISRLATDKDGYGKINRTKFGNSFFPELHTLQTLYETLTSGYAMIGEFKRELPGAKALERNPNLCTYRHTENFISTQVLSLDDDGKFANSVEFWQNDPFFNQYGAFAHESASSKPAKQKVHAFFVLLDHVIRTPEEYKEAMFAIAEYYPRIDRLSDCTRVTYGAKQTNAWMVGNYLPYDSFLNEILEPYRLRKRVEDMEIDMQMINRRELAAKSTLRVDDTATRRYIIARLDGLEAHLRSLTAGDNRHNQLVGAGCLVSSGRNSSWTGTNRDLFDRFESRVIDAFTHNGYLADHAGNEREIRRVYADGLAIGGREWEAPIATESWFLFDVGDQVATSDGKYKGKIVSRHRPFAPHTNEQYSAYRLDTTNIVLGEHQLHRVVPATKISVLDSVTPALTAVQKIQVLGIIEQEKIVAYQAAAKNVTLPFPPGVGEAFQVGAKITEDGEILISYPMMHKGGIQNIEYVSDMVDTDGNHFIQRTYEVNSPAYLYNATDHIDNPQYTIVMTTIEDAITTSLFADTDTCRVLGMHQLDLMGEGEELQGKIVFPNFSDVKLTGMTRDKLFRLANGRKIYEPELPFKPIDMLRVDTRTFMNYIA